MSHNDGVARSGSSKIWWAVIAVLVVVVLAVVYLTSHHTRAADANAAANGTGAGLAYDATTGRNVPANAAPNAVSGQGYIEQNTSPNATAGGQAGGTEAATFGTRTAGTSNGPQFNTTGATGDPTRRP